MSNSEEATYSMDFEGESSKSSPSHSQSYSSVAESSKKKATEDGEAAGTLSGRSDGSGTGAGSRDDTSKGKESGSDEVGDKLAPLSARSTQSGAMSVEDDSKSTSSQQLSNAIEKYEASLKRNEGQRARSSTDMSEISEIMRQLEDIEKTRGPLESYLHQGRELDALSASFSQGAASNVLRTIEELQDSSASGSKGGQISSTQSEASEIDDIDEIIKKLESLDKAQTALQSALSKSELDTALSTTAGLGHPASYPGTLMSTSRLVALNSLQQQISKSIEQHEQVSAPADSNSPPAPPQAPVVPVEPQSVDTADEMSTISELNSGRNQHQALDEVSKPQLVSSESSARSTAKEEGSTSKSEDAPRERQTMGPPRTRSRQSSSSSRNVSGRIATTSRKDSSKENQAQSSADSQKEQVEEKMKSEIMRQDTLISAFQKEIELLSNQLNTEKSNMESKERQHADELNQLKIEIATMKLSNLVPVLPSSPRLGQKGQMERLREDLNAKSNQVMDLQREIARLKVQAKNTQAAVDKEGTAASAIPEDKEKEYQKSIRALEKQVRTLQKLAFHKDKDPSVEGAPAVQAQPPLSKKFGSKTNVSARSVSSAGTQTQRPTEGDLSSKRHCAVLEHRIAELENELLKADSDARAKVKEFQERLNSLTAKYEARINELEKKLREVEEKRNSNCTGSFGIQDVTAKLERAQAEIANYKIEVNRYKRESDILMKTSKATQSSSRKDSNALSLALKSFKVELAEKEKELVRAKKEIGDLKKTTASLKRERERYLHSHSAHPTVPIYTRAKSDLSESPKKNRGVLSKQAAMSFEDLESSGVKGSKVPNYTLEYLQSTLEDERKEFENILKEKNNLIEAKEKEIKDFEHKLDKMDIPVNRRDSLEEKNLLVEELRIRIQAQNKVIETLKNHMAAYSGVEHELRTLRQEKGHLEFRTRELNQKLVLAKTLSKPENEILGDLMEKVENLYSRIFYREKQFDLLLNRLSTKSFASSQIPIVDPSDIYASNTVGHVSPSLDTNLVDI